MGGVTIETRHLRIFTAVYRNKSFTKAAEQLFTSQPTVSEHIRNLESYLNCSLFDRMGRSIIPTKEANILYPKAVAILEDLQKLEDEVAMAGKTVTGELVIGASTIPGAYLLPSIASKFKQQYPRISFEVQIDDSAKIVTAIQENNLLLGIVGAKIPARQINYIPFADDELVLVAAPDNPIPATIKPNDLLKQPFILRESGSGTLKNTEILLSEKNIGLDRMNIAATLGSSTAVKEAVKSDLGVSFISMHAVKDELEYGSLKKIEVQGVSMERNLFIAIAKKRSLPHHYQVFLDFLKNLAEV